MATMTNGISWFEIGTDDPAGAQRFYGGLFGWTFEPEGPDYRVITTPAAGSIGGGIMDTKGQAPNYAVFYVQVEDVAATCEKAETAGGKVVVAPHTAPNGLALAHLLDPAGNHFAVYTPPAEG